MKKQKVTREQTEEYIKFLEKRLNSNNFKNNVSPEEYEKTKQKLEKARLKLKLGFYE